MILFILVEIGHLFVSLPKDVVANSIIGKVAMNYEKEKKLDADHSHC